MKYCNVNDFLEHAAYEEVAVRYHGKKYFFHGLLRNPDTGRFEFTIDLWDDADRYVDTVYRASAQTAEECMRRFLTDAIIDGRRFWEIEGGNGMDRLVTARRMSCIFVYRTVRG